MGGGSTEAPQSCPVRLTGMLTHMLAELLAVFISSMLIDVLSVFSGCTLSDVQTDMLRLGNSC